MIITVPNICLARWNEKDWCSDVLNAFHQAEADLAIAQATLAIIEDGYDDQIKQFEADAEKLSAKPFEAATDEDLAKAKDLLDVALNKAKVINHNLNNTSPTEYN